jgi:hypothetical protein
MDRLHVEMGGYGNQGLGSSKRLAFVISLESKVWVHLAARNQFRFSSKGHEVQFKVTETRRVGKSV